MPDPQTLLMHLLLPALVTGGLLLLISRAWRKPSAMAVRIAWAVALPIGYAVGHYRIHGLPAFDRMPHKYWLLIIAMTMALMLIIGALLRGRGIVATVLAAIPIAIMPALLLLDLGHRDVWSTSQWLVWSGALGAVCVAMLLAMRALETRSDVGLPIGFTFTAMAWGVFVWSCGAMIDGQLSMTLAGALGGGVAACFVLPREYRHAGSASIGIGLVLGQLILGYFYVYGLDDPNDDKWIRTLLVAAAPLTMWLAQFVWPRDTRAVGRVVFVAVLLALVVGPTARRYYEEIAGDDGPAGGSAWDTSQQ